jgi:hypothetical protein
MNTIKQIVIPFNNVPFSLLWKNRATIQKNGWHAVITLFRKKTIKIAMPIWVTLIAEFSGFWNPWGTRRHMAYVKAECDESGKVTKIVEYNFDAIVISDGPTAEFWGNATPSVMVVITGEGKDGTYVRSVKELRPVIVNPLTGVAGGEIEESIPGTWANAGEDMIDAARRAMKKSGFAIPEGVIPQIEGWQDANRQWVATSFPTVSMPYAGENTIVVLDDDIIMRGGAHRLDQFPDTKDSLVKASLWDYAQNHGHISAVPVQQLLDQIQELKSKLGQK